MGWRREDERGREGRGVGRIGCAGEEEKSEVSVSRKEKPRRRDEGNGESEEGKMRLTSSSSEIALSLCWLHKEFPSFQHVSLGFFGVLDVLQTGTSERNERARRGEESRREERKGEVSEWNSKGRRRIEGREWDVLHSQIDFGD